jgi:hypothetical protein
MPLVLGNWFFVVLELERCVAWKWLCKGVAMYGLQESMWEIRHAVRRFLKAADIFEWKFLQISHIIEPLEAVDAISQASRSAQGRAKGHPSRLFKSEPDERKSSYDQVVGSHW